MKCQHCDKKVRARGLCSTHYNREYRKAKGFPRTGWRKAIIDGQAMGVREMVRYVEENRNYTLTRHTIARRMNAGLRGEDLIGPPNGREVIEEEPTWGRCQYKQKLVRVDIPGWGVRTG